MTIEWNDKRVARLRRLVDKGIRYADIGKLIGCNKNAVCGAVRRYILQGNAPRPERRAMLPTKLKPGTTKPGTRSFMKRKGGFQRGYQPAPVESVEIPAADGPGVYLLDLTHFQCRYPLEGRWMFCGEPQTKGCYCAEHAALCYRPDRPARTEGFRIPAWRVAA